MRALLFLIVVLAIALVAGDRIAVAAAQNAIGRKIAAEYALSREPEVDIAGVPFLTQAVEGNYREIRIRAAEWTDRDVTVRDLDLTLTDVAAPLSDLLANRTDQLVATTATATAVVPYDTVLGYAPDGVESITDGPDGLEVTGTFSVEGIPVPVPATVVLAVEPAEGGIAVTPMSIRAAVGGPAVPLALLRGALTFQVPLAELPLGARLTAIRPGPDGLEVTATAVDVHFSELS